MKLSFSHSSTAILFALAWMISPLGVEPLRAQAAPPQAAIRFANACSIEGKVVFAEDGRSMRTDGFSAGENTSAIGTPAGSHRFTVSATGAKPADATLNLQANTATMLIAYSKATTDPVTQKTVQELQLFAQADPARQKGKRFFLLYLSSRPSAEIIVNGKPRSLPALHLVPADEVSRGEVRIEEGGKSVLDFVANENGNFHVILFDKPDGSLNGILLPDYG